LPVSYKPGKGINFLFDTTELIEKVSMRDHMFLRHKKPAVAASVAASSGLAMLQKVTDGGQWAAG
jgi:hypothetical protein